MGSDYDEFSERAYSNYPALSDSSRYYRNLLKNVMEKSQFSQYEYEWWHFDFKDWKNYPVMNVQFEDIE
jgi:D-alanyl-D-alanine dipeptidase